MDQLERNSVEKIDDRYVMQADGGSITIDSGTADISVNSLGLRLDFGLSKDVGAHLEENFVVMDAQNGVQQVFRSTDSGFVMYTIIDDPFSTSLQRIGYDMISEGKLELATTVDGTADGSIAIYDDEGKVVGAIGATMVYDANGKPVACAQTLDDSSFSFIVDAAGEEYSYPLVSITPFNSTTVFYTYYWGYIQRLNYGATGCVSLGLYPMDWGALSTAEKEVRWSAVVSFVTGSLQWPYWTNESGMRSQFMCHLNLAFAAGDEWNLEPSRQGTATIFNLCNPGTCP